MEEKISFDVGAALAEQVPLTNINQELATQKGFDYQGAKDSLVESYRQNLLREGITEENISLSSLAEQADEDILVELSDGKIVKEQLPKLRGATQAVLVDIPAGAAMLKGAQKGFQLSMKVPGPYKIPAAIAGTVGGGATAMFGTAKLGDFAFGKFFEGEDVIPSQRPIVEAARTYSGTLGSLFTIPILFKEAAGQAVNLGAKWLEKNIDDISNKWLRRAARPAQYATRFAEKSAEAVRQPYKADLPSVKRGIAAAGFSAAPATGAYFAEKIDPYDPLTRAGSELVAPMLIPGRLLTSLGVGGLRAIGDGIAALSTSGRLDAASRQMIGAIENINKQYALGELDIDRYREELITAMDQPELFSLIKRVNESLPEAQRLQRPELTVAQLTGDPYFEAMERGARAANKKAEGSIPFDEQSRKMQQDFLVFGNRIVSELLKQSNTNPELLKDAAELQEGLFTEVLTRRLESARDAAVATSEKVQTPLKRSALSETLVSQVLKAYDEATSTGNRLYDAAKEKLASTTIVPNNTLKALLELKEVTPLPSNLKTLLGDLSPDMDELGQALQTAERKQQLEFDNFETLRIQARDYLGENPRARTFLQNLATPVEDVISFAPGNPNSLLNLIDDALSEIAAIGSRTKESISAEAFLKNARKAFTAKVGLDDSAAEVDAAREALANASSSEISLNRLLRAKSEMGQAQRNLSPNVNKRQEVFDYGQIEEAVMQDIDELLAISERAMVDPTTGQLSLLPEGTRAATSEGLELLFKANAFHRAKHDIFTRTFANEIFKRTTQGNRALDPKLFAQKLFAGSADGVSRKMLEVEDAVNFVNSGAFRGSVEDLPEEVAQELQNSAVARLGTFEAAQTDLLKSFLRKVIDRDPTSPNYKQINPRAAQTYLNENAEALEPLFPAVFKDLRDALAGRRSVDDLASEIAEREADLNKTTQLFRMFSRLEDTPGRIVGELLGSPGNRPVNAVKNFKQLIKEIDDVGAANPDFSTFEAKKALADVVLDRAWVFAGGADSSKPFDFIKFRQYLFNPLNQKEGPSIAKLLEEAGVLEEKQFNNYRILLDQADRISKVMSKSGPQYAGELVDKGFILQNILARAAGAISGNMALNVAKRFTGNVPGASMSVAQTTSDATAKLGLGVPQAKIKDIFIKAFSDRDTAEMLLARPPRTKKEFVKYATDFPVIMGNIGIRQGVDISRGDEIEVPIGEKPQERQEIRPPLRAAQPPQPAPRPTAQAPMPMPMPMPQIPMPMPQPAPAPAQAAPAPQQRARYAALFPEDPISGLLQSGGIASLAS